ncbi:MAG TPA: hypothetical protein VEJ47_14690 [Candidatus Eremiobacteraceae bacterium]|nr:hypothetical protein [Candidatus Eremiobacteraceae bacterium]
MKPGAAPFVLSARRPCALYPVIAAAILFAFLLSLHISGAQQVPENDLTVHEWGTFTSISGPDGRSMDWLPLTGSTDLPSFVEHFRDVKFKGGLHGTVRMETPVLYFYSPRELTVSVDVAFSRGLITEWYPHADSANPALDEQLLTLYRQKSPGAISWRAVHIDPHVAADFPSDNSGNHYYAARQTASAPVAITTSSGAQLEKFLFYRGVAVFPSPVQATLSSGHSLQLKTTSADPVPEAILFERRGAKLGYRVLGPLQDQLSFTEPALEGSLDSLSSELEGVLISQGLFPDEAHAMLETWRDSWFEEGARLIYIVPRSFVDSILPLTINPVPANTVRVFVGRLELITPETQRILESALAAGDHGTLAKYSRFLEPILTYMIQRTKDEQRQKQLLIYLESAPVLTATKTHP